MCLQSIEVICLVMRCEAVKWMVILLTTMVEWREIQSSQFRTCNKPECSIYWLVYICEAGSLQLRSQRHGWSWIYSRVFTHFLPQNSTPLSISHHHKVVHLNSMHLPSTQTTFATSFPPDRWCDSRQNDNINVNTKLMPKKWYSKRRRNKISPASVHIQLLWNDILK